MEQARLALESGFQSLETVWANIQTDWDDSVTRYFEQEFVQPILMETPPLIKSMDEVALVFDRARRELD